MRIYLAAAFKRKSEVKNIAIALESIGVEVTSRWLDEKPCPDSEPAKSRFFRETALMDLADIRSADAIVRFTDYEVTNTINQAVDRTLATGARHFECGYALSQGKAVIVVGGPQNVFDYLPNVTHLRTLADLYTFMRGAN